MSSQASDVKAGSSVKGTGKHEKSAELVVKQQKIESLTQRQKQVLQTVWDKSDYATTSEGVPLNEEVIDELVEKLAQTIVAEYADKNPVLVPLLDGAWPFATRLYTKLKQLGFEFDYSTMNPSSYGHGFTSGEMAMGALPKLDVTGRHVLIVDDLCDTGNTLKKIENRIQTQGPASVASMVLLDKKLTADKKKYQAKYHGAQVPCDAFLIGFGLDLYDCLRATPSVRYANTALMKELGLKGIIEQKNALAKEIKALIREINSASQSSIREHGKLLFLNTGPTSGDQMAETSQQAGEFRQP